MTEARAYYRIVIERKRIHRHSMSANIAYYVLCYCGTHMCIRDAPVTFRARTGTLK